MKCPDCKFVCSELRDICPKCAVDLRPFKKEQGLPVTRVDASYEELLAKAGIRLVQEKSGSARVSEVKKGWLSRVFGTTPVSERAQPAGPVAGESCKEGAVADSVATRTKVDNVPILSPQSISSGVSSRIEAEMESAVSHELDKVAIAADEAVRALAHQDISLVGQEQEPQPAIDVKNERELDDLIDSIISEAHGEVDQTASTIVPAFPEPELSESLKSDEQAESSESAVSPVLAIEPQTQEQCLTSPVQSLVFQEVEASGAAGDLFLEAQRDLIRIGSMEGYSFSQEQFNSGRSVDEMAMLFELAEGFLRDPSSEGKWQERLISSEERHVEASRKLEQQIQQTEKVLSAPVFTLRPRTEGPPAGQAATESAIASSSHARTSNLENAGIFARSAGFLIDATMTILLSFGAGLILSAIFWQDRWKSFYETGSLDWLDLFPLFAVSLAVVPVVAFLYLLLTSITGGASWGQHGAGLRLVQAAERELSYSNLIVRAASFPLSVLAQGWLLLPFTGRALHDYISRTRVVKFADQQG